MDLSIWKAPCFNPHPTYHPSDAGQGADYCSLKDCFGLGSSCDRVRPEP